MKLIFRKFAVSLVLSASIVTAHASDFLSNPPEDVFSFAVLTLPYQLRNEKPWSKIISTQKEWQTYYDQLTEGLVFIAPVIPPTIDFTQYQIITGGLGVKNSGGYSVIVDRVDERSDSIAVNVLDVSPGQGCAVTLAITYPMTTILFKKTEKPIQFSLSKLTRECQ